MNSPIRISLKSEIISLLAVVFVVAVSVMSYGRLPERVISHWNWQGEPDGWLGRGFHAFFFPFFLAAIYGLFLVLPRIDPNKDRYAEFSRVYGIFRSMILWTLALVYFLATLANLGYDVNIGIAAPIIIGILMLSIGNYLAKVKKNWFMGIRTPWTLSSEKVWQKTHRLGGALFVLFGIGLMLTPFLPYKAGLVVFIAGVSSVVIVPAAASYIYFRKEKQADIIK